MSVKEFICLRTGSRPMSELFADAKSNHLNLFVHHISQIDSGVFEKNLLMLK